LPRLLIPRFASSHHWQRPTSDGSLTFAHSPNCLVRSPPTKTPDGTTNLGRITFILLSANLQHSYLLATVRLIQTVSGIHSPCLHHIHRYTSLPLFLHLFPSSSRSSTDTSVLNLHCHDLQTTRLVYIHSDIQGVLVPNFPNLQLPLDIQAILSSIAPHNFATQSEVHDDSRASTP
jgi:hypothetical protein